MSAPGCEILAVGLATPVGLDARSASTAIRAGICRHGSSRVRDLDGEPQTMSLVPDAYLPPLAAPLRRSRGRTAACARRLSLAALALQEAAARCPEPAPLLLALPDEVSGGDPEAGPHFLSDLALQAGVALDLHGSRVRRGTAGGLHALRDALALLAADPSRCALVGGVDTFLDLGRLAALDAEDRLAPAGSDGFVPGEGAAFLLVGTRVSRRRLGLDALARVVGVGLGDEAGHRGSPEPYRGDGLAAAFRTLLGALPPDHAPVRCVYAGFNGENLPAKEWGVAYLRHAQRFAEGVRVEHPADCIGDAGAALGPIMLALAAAGIAAGHREAPCLVWSTSDGPERAAALLEAAG